MTPKNIPATKTPDAPREGGSALESLTASVAGFEAAQSEALAAILAHAASVGEEVAELAARPTREELATVQGQLDQSRADHARETGELTARVAERDAELKALRTARDTDAETIASLRERFRSFEAAAQNIMAGLSVDELAPATVSVPEPAPAPEATAAASPEAHEPAESAPVPEQPAPAPVEDPFDLGLEDLPAAAPEVPARGIVLPDLDEDPFVDDPTRVKLLAAAAGNADPFDLPEHAQADGAGFVFNPVPAEEAEEAAAAPEEAAEAPEATAGTVAADPFGFMDVDLAAEDAPPAPATQESPKVIPVYI